MTFAVKADELELETKWEGLTIPNFSESKLVHVRQSLLDVVRSGKGQPQILRLTHTCLLMLLRPPTRRRSRWTSDADGTVPWSTGRSEELDEVSEHESEQ